MDISKDEINPNKRWCLCKKKGIVGSKGNRFKNKSGWGGAGGRAQGLPPQCVPREKHIGTSLNGYIASKNGRIKKEAHRHKSRWIFWKKNPKKRCLWAKGKRVGSKGSRWKNKSGWVGPLQCVPRKSMKEVHRHKSRWRSMKMKWTQITDDAYEKGIRVGSKGSRLKQVHLRKVVIWFKTKCERMVHVCFGMFWSQIYVALTCISTQYFCNGFRTRPKTMPKRGPNKARK